MTFNGVPITSSKILEKEIERLPRVKRVNFEDYLGYDSHIYVCDERQREVKKDFSR